GPVASAPDIVEEAKSPAATQRSREWLLFRLCEVYSAPRLPHIFASDWTRIVESSEQMRFGFCKFAPMAGVDHKDRERWQLIKSGQLKPKTEQRPRRPRVPPAPRRQVARPTDVPRAESPKPAPPPKPGEAKKRELPAPCVWCGQLDPTHPKQCKLRIVECKHCKQQLELGALRLHFKGCAARPAAPLPRRDSRGSGGFAMLQRLQSTAKTLAQQLTQSLQRVLAKQPLLSASEASLLMASLDNKLQVLSEELSTFRARFERRSVEDRLKGDVEDAQMRLYLLQGQVLLAEKIVLAWESSLKSGERSKLRSSLSRLQSTVQTIHRQLDDLSQQAVHMDMGDPRHNASYAPAQLESELEALKEEVTALDRSQETQLAQGASPKLQGLTDLQGRLHFFQELLVCITEATSRSDQASSFTGFRVRPSSRKPLREEDTQAPDVAESSPLPPERGPAAMGLREVSLDQMKQEILEERKRFIAYHLVRRPQPEKTR
ncbi:unnamed protein product, partial [Effrenium voratum]